MKRIFAALLACSLILCGCNNTLGGVSSDTSSDTSSGTSSDASSSDNIANGNSDELAPFPNPDGVYYLNNFTPAGYNTEDAIVVNAKGEVLAQGSSFSMRMLYDRSNNDEQRYIVVPKYPDMKMEGSDYWDVSSKTAFKLLALDGTPVTDYIAGSADFAWGNLIVYSTSAKTDNPDRPFIHSNHVMRIDTGEIIFTGNDYSYTKNFLIINRLDDGFIAIDKSGKIVADHAEGFARSIYDSDTNLITGMAHRQDIELWEYVGDIYGKHIVDARFSFARCNGDENEKYLVLNHDNVTTVYSAADGKLVSSLADKDVDYFDGECAIVKTPLRNAVLTDASGNALSDEYTYISPITGDNSGGKREYFEGVRVLEDTHNSFVLDRNGKEIFSGGSLYFYYYKEAERFLASGQGTGIVYSLKGEKIFSTDDMEELGGKIDYVSNGWQHPHLSVTCKIGKAYLQNVYDLDGKPIITGARQASYLSDGLYSVSKGFDWGIMNSNGEWVYKTSVFSSMDQE